MSLVSAKELVEKYAKLTTELQKISDNVVSRTNAVNSIWSGLATLGSVSVTTAASVLLGRLKVEYLRQSWQSSTMDDMLRVGSGKQLLAKLEAFPTAERSQLGLKPDQLYMVFRNYLMPGCLSGLTFIGAGDRNSISVCTLPIDRESQDTGFIIHPETAVRNLPIVLTTNTGVWLKMLFIQLNGTSEFPAAVLVFDSTRKQFIPKTRKSIIWTAELNADAVSMAKQFTNLITRVGANNGCMSAAAEKQWRAGRMFEFLAGTAKPWMDQLKDQFDRLSMSEVISLVTSIDLSSDEQEELLPMLPPHIAEKLGERIESLPQLQIDIKGGSITQKVDGWYLESRGTVRQVTNMPFRILRTVRGEQLQYQVQVYQSGQWESFLVPTKRMHEAPVKTLTELTIEAQLRPFQADASIARNLLFYAEMLNPPLKSQPESDDLGLDVLRGVLRTNRLRITLDPFSIEPMNSVTEAKLLSYADELLPDAAGLTEVMQSKLATQVLNCLVMQSIRYMVGRNPLAVTYGSAVAPRVHKLLADLEVLNAYWPCDFSGIDLSKVSTQSVIKLKSQSGIWTTLTEDMSNWLALERPLMNLGFKPGRMPEVPQRTIQRTFMQLLIRSLKVLTEKSISPSQALTTAWGGLLKACQIQLELPSIIQPMSSQIAIAHWLRRGLEIGHFKKYGRAPKDMRGAIVMGSDNVQFLRDDIQVVLEKLKLPAVNMVAVVARSVDKGSALSSYMNASRSVLKLMIDPAKISPRGGDLSGSSTLLG